MFFEQSGSFLTGVLFENSGVWFDNSGGVWFDNAGGVYFDNAGGVFFDNSGGVFFDNSGGVFFENSGQEITFEEAKSFGRGRPHKVGRASSAGRRKPVTRRMAGPAPRRSRHRNYHRIEVLFEQLQVGGVDYEIERKSVEPSRHARLDFSVAGTVAAHLVRFTDPDELADGKEYTYRVRGLRPTSSGTAAGRGR